MSGIDLCVGNCGRGQMALQTDSIHIRQYQELGIFPAMRHMAGGAAYLLDDRMIVDPWAGQVGVALETCGGLLRNGRLQPRLKRAVRIVTGGALYGTVIGLVMHRRGEVALYASMTLITEAGLRRFQ